MTLRRVPHAVGRLVVAAAALPLLVAAALTAPKGRRTLVWGPVPIINNRYWSEAMKAAGWDSLTLMHTFYPSINKRTDYDLLFDDLVPRFVRPARLRNLFGPYAAALYVLRHAGVSHIPFSGGPLWTTPLRRLEAWLQRLANVKTVAIPYGSDVFQYSRIESPVVLDGLLRTAPGTALRETRIRSDVEYWTRNADVIVVGHALDGLGRWDVAAGNIVCLDTDLWLPKVHYSPADGVSGPVVIVHTPNHRGAKGTEFLLGAVQLLRDEGLEIDLVLLEGAQNDEVRRILRERADVVADQFLLPGYGLAAIEAMATGLPVVCNLEDSRYTELFRLYSFLNECPVVSASPRTLADTLRALVTNPDLRRELGLAGRAFVEKYESYEAAQYLFGAIYARLLDGAEVDLRNLFHPASSEYNRRRPRVEHPLVDNRLPERYLALARGVDV